MTAQLAQQADAGRLATRVIPPVRLRQVEDLTIRANVAYNRAARRRGVSVPVRVVAMVEGLRRCVASTDVSTDAGEAL